MWYLINAIKPLVYRHLPALQLTLPRAVIYDAFGHMLKQHIANHVGFGLISMHLQGYTWRRRVNK